MWSGPRNISTAMMRAWENRSDTFVTDEPFYAHYLAHTRLDHPGREAILKSQSTDWREVATDCIEITEADRAIHYQKHMTQHILRHIELDWLTALHNIFLIRSPQEVINSYAKSRPELNASDLGFEQQARLFQFVRNNIEEQPLVISSADLLKNPRTALTIMCEHCGIAFDENMLSWPPGKRESDGVWSPWWYHNVERSSGFEPPTEERKITLNREQQIIADECQIHFDLLAKYAVTLDNNDHTGNYTNG